MRENKTALVNRLTRKVRVSLFFIFSLSFVGYAQAQTDWKRLDRMMEEGSYKSCYQKAEAVYRSGATLRERLIAARYMARASASFMEDFADSAEARYRALLPELRGADRSVCYAMLGEVDSALIDSVALQRTPSDLLAPFCMVQEGKNMTPTAYDVVALYAVSQGAGGESGCQALLNSLASFHKDDGDDLRIWYDLQLLTHIPPILKGEEVVARTRCYLDKYRGSRSPLLAILYSRMAGCLGGLSRYVEAVAYCDTALALFPGSQGAAECSPLRHELCDPRFNIERPEDDAVPGQATLLILNHRNVAKLYFNVYRYDGGDLEKTVSKGKPVASWTLALDDDGSHRSCETPFAVPALAAGRYMLVASLSPTPRENYAHMELHCTEMRIVCMENKVGQIFDCRTGAPIVGQEVLCFEEEEPRDTLRTDSNGRFFLPQLSNPWQLKIRVERGGYTYNERFSADSPEEETMSQPVHVEVMMDRPVYRPGDTVRLAVVAYQSDGLNGKVAQNTNVYLTLRDPNSSTRAADTLTTDSLGSAQGFFVIPVDGLVGNWEVGTYVNEDGFDIGCLFKVEEYKAPRFMVQLEQDVVGTPADQAPRFGRRLTVRGQATSYTGIPLTGSKVHYHVERAPCYFGNYFGDSRTVEVAHGDTVVGADGAFSLSFVPLPDSTVNLAGQVTFTYTIRVDVTDINGESHDATLGIKVGNVVAEVEMVIPWFDVNELKTLRYSYHDLNGRPLDGDVKITLERLALPRPMRYTPWYHNDNDHICQGIPEEEYRRLFPYYFYSKEESSCANWQTVARTEVEHHAVGGQTVQDVALPDVPSGYYRVTIMADSSRCQEYITLTKPGERRVQSPWVLWLDSKSTARVGEKFVLRYGSVLGPQRVFYTLTGHDGEELGIGWLTADGKVDSLVFTIDSAMLGGVVVNLLAVTRDGRTYNWSLKVDVPFDHKRLTVEVATFRDHLLPGAQEEWTLTVKDPQAAPVAGAGLVLTMYDAALNEYGRQEWSINPWRRASEPSIDWGNRWVADGGYFPSYKGYDIKGPKFGQMRLDVDWFMGGASRRRMYKSVPMLAMARGENVVVDDDIEVAVEVTEEEIEQKVNYEEVEIEEEMEESVVVMADSDGDPTPPMQVRTSLRPLAFFAPALRTGKDGSTTYRFAVPELLTRWQVRGLAFTADLRSGVFERQLVTRKPLMVQPNMPRFLRQGDSLSFMAKVVLNDEELRMKNEELPVAVIFQLTDAATGDTICCQRKRVQLRDVASVMFDVVVPRHVYVAVYRIVAYGEGMSDGEQGQLAVVSDRQAVTVSRSMYINGVGEKSVGFPLRDYLASPTAEPNLLAAEVVGCPEWLAVQAMPHLAEVENPSNLYLANSLYIGNIAQSVLEEFKDLRDFKDHWDTAEVPLMMNQSVKQTLLEATPWVQEAQAEVEQRKAMAAYFDSARMAEELPRLSAQLAARQNADGGWSWMPGGESSLWVTRQIVKRLPMMVSMPKECAARALEYLDKEEQAYYVKHVKPHRKTVGECGPDNVDYLYARLFYGKGKTEAYRYYYANALKHYKKYDNLYTQAQLALVFQRGGDRKVARDIIRRIKEKSLVSDEMGMYWRDNKRGWCWYERPIETQALLVQAFMEVDFGDLESIALMQQWLLKQKQTTHWGNDVATVEAIRAILMVGYGDGCRNADSVLSATLTVGDTVISVLHSPFSTLHTPLPDTLPIVFAHYVSGPAWASVHFQYTDQMENIPAASSGIAVTRSYHSLSPLPALHVGDRVKVSIEVRCDRAMDYLEVIDMRPACFEPVSTEAGRRWDGGLSYYAAPGNTVSRFYVDHVEKGTYRLEYDVYVTNPGLFRTGAATVQCLYAPEFRASSTTGVVEVSE